MRYKHVLTAAFFLAALPLPFTAFSQGVEEADGFHAEGVTEPVLPEDNGIAVKVTFPEEDFHMIFDPPPKAAYYTPEGIGFSNEWAESASNETEHPGWGEVLFDRDAVMWLERESPARKVVRFRGVIKTPGGEVLHTYVDSGSPYGEGDWSDEWYYIYPDGVSARVVKIYTGKAEDAVALWGLPGHCAFWGIRGTVFETQETFIHGVPRIQPPDIIETEALTLITMDGQSKRISYKTYPPDCSLFEPANIQMVNLKSAYHPFTIVTEGNVEVKPYYMPMDDHRNIDKTVFITWPRKGHFGPNESYTSALSHVIKWGWHEKTENTLVQIYLLGMTDEPTEEERIAKLVTLAKSWERAPELTLEGDGYHYDGYEIKEKAYIIAKTADNNDLLLSIKASPERPLHNPAFVIKDMGKNRIFTLMLDGTKVENYRAGYEGENLVLWIPFTSTEDTSLRLVF
jgi:hypothetical protein